MVCRYYLLSHLKMGENGYQQYLTVSLKEWEEPLPKIHSLMFLDNVILSLHCAGSTRESNV